MVPYRCYVIKADVTLSCVFHLLLLGCLKGYSSHWAHFLGGNITYINFKENKRHRNKIIKLGGNHGPGRTVPVCQPLSYSSTGKSEGPALLLAVGKALTAFKLLMLRTLLDTIFLLSLQKFVGLSCWMSQI